MARKPKSLSPDVLSELQELNRFANAFLFIANEIQENTALVPDGQAEAKKYQAISTLIENKKQAYLAQALQAFKTKGSVSVNLSTGEITDVK